MRGGGMRFIGRGVYMTFREWAAYCGKGALWLIRHTGEMLRDGIASFLRWLGPVAGAVKGELSKEEARKVLAAAGITAMSAASTEAARAAFIHNVELWSVVGIPCLLAIAIAVLESGRRAAHGEPPTNPEPSKDDHPTAT